MSTALIQMGCAVGFEVWATTRNDEGAAIAEHLGANRIFRHGDQLPRRTDAVVTTPGPRPWADSLRAVKRGVVVVINGVTTGHAAETDLLRIFVEQVDIHGTIMGTLEEMKAMAGRNTNWMAAPARRSCRKRSLSAAMSLSVSAK
ncbi:MAG TPA: zinc-binding dehydrogenase [Paraburkholderia sp.]|nr:zinc-binding dehydrogenase [Paraburkholderia sp.]HKR44144.1 zinc-binding dehydrogenase [Paraburkholderia sp.]